jgi:UPF0755 protein
LNARRTGILVLVLLLLTGGAGGWLYRQLHQAAHQIGSATEIQRFEVPQGSSMRAVLQALQQQQLITDARKIEWFLRCCKRGTPLAAGNVKAGRYRIVPGQPPLEILRQLMEGRVALERVTILEGWTFAQMREHLAKQADIPQTLAGRSDAEIMAALGVPDLAAEGRFAPDTYVYSPDITTDMQILAMAFQAQQENLQQAWGSRQQNLPLGTPAEALTLASIVEKETGLGSERARVAGVFVNRLRKGMLLQTDPTVIYGMGDRYDGNLRKSDLTRDTPYNTYTRTGLPPTPIALPGRKAIVAALNPEKTDALFFVALGDGSGGHCFSATMSEHSLCVQQYLHRLRNPPMEVPAPEPAASAEPVSVRNPDEPPP